MRALVSTATPPHAELGEVPDPTPRPDQALVEVHAISLNRGETRRLETLAPGTVTGWDLAGVVRQPAADGGPPAGTRVVGMINPGAAWAEQAAVDLEWLAELPDGISFEQASTLPVAGLTALHALEHGGFLVGKRVLITAASGGVGHLAIQLAKLAGAHVTAVARRGEGLTELGADDVLSELAPEGSNFDLIVEGVGGDVLGAALGRVALDGLVVSFASTLPETTFPTRSFFGRGSGAQLYGLYIFHELAHTRSGSSDLRRLADLVAAGRLDPQIDLVLPWSRAGEAIEALLDRRVSGKAVLTIDRQDPAEP